jgi:hypothetical protein
MMLRGISAVCAVTALLFVSQGSVAQINTNTNKFKQLGQDLPTPNVYRTASGAPGHEYYQQQADYDMQIEIDDVKQVLSGAETITYRNNSPDKLTYVWLQLDQNMRAKDSDTKKIQTGAIKEGKVGFRQMKKMHSDFDGGFKLDYVQDASGKAMKYTINKTMMRIDLPKALLPKGTVSFKIKWSYNINDRMKDGGRSGYEYFADEDNYLYTIAQFFPRMCVYNEVEGWQHKQFLGNGEFALAFGNYKVAITVPSDHIVAATGVLQNESSVLTSEQRKRVAQARMSTDQPVIIVTEEEAREAEKNKATGKKTWIFKAENVRDFGLASSRKFIWDAMAVKQSTKTVLAMSYYPKEGNPLWEQYSTKAVAQTLRTFSHHTFDYPYPVAISVHTKWIGMEYPMICFNGGRPEADGTYSEGTRNGMISVIIHEVGHNYFPMIVNSDERQWTWMDEGLNTFLQYLTEQDFERNYPSRRGPAYKIVGYMKGDKSNIVPIMTNSEQLAQFGNNAYGKPATALNILRETVMGRELFDYAFREYAQRWMFKHPTPADLFRTMEDASGMDLDWFWRGWFYTTDHVDISMDKVAWYRVDSKDPDVEKPLMVEEKKNDAVNISERRYAEAQRKTYNENDDKLTDFYTNYNPLEVTVLDRQDYEKFVERMSDDEKALINSKLNYYQIDFTNKGGLVMPVILRFTFADGTSEKMNIPAEIWQEDNAQISKLFWFEKEVTEIALDPELETADTDLNNNYWPARTTPTRFDLYKAGYGRRGRGGGSENPMQREKRAEGDGE